MTTKMNLNRTTRKALVAAIAEITGEKAIYRAMPTCNYNIGDITVTKDGCIIFPDDSDILTALAEAGFTPESNDAAEQDETTGLTVSLPKDGFNDSAIDNLRKLVDAKATLIQKALGADRLDIEITEDTVSFAWWDTCRSRRRHRLTRGSLPPSAAWRRRQSGSSPRRLR